MNFRKTLLVTAISATFASTAVMANTTPLPNYQLEVGTHLFKDGTIDVTINEDGSKLVGKGSSYITLTTKGNLSMVGENGSFIVHAEDGITTVFDAEGEVVYEGTGGTFLPPQAGNPQKRTLGSKTSTTQQAAIFNQIMDMSGKGAYATVDKDGNALYFNGNDEVLTPDEVKSRLSKAAVINHEAYGDIRTERRQVRGGFGVEPIKKNQLKTDIANRVLIGQEFELGEGINGAPATISGVVVSPDGLVEAKITYNDEHGNSITRTASYQADGSHNVEVKAAVTAYIQSNQGDHGNDPIENEPTVPTRGEWVADKKAELKEKFGDSLPTAPNGKFIAKKKAELKEKFGNNMPTEPRHNNGETAKQRMAEYKENIGGNLPTEPRHNNGETAKQRMAEYKEQIGGNLPTEPRHDNGDTAKEKMAAFKAQGTANLAARIEEAKNNNQKDTNPVIPAPEFNFNDQYQNMLTAEIEELDTKMDSVMASTHAINNARPFLSGAGKTSIGIGMGYAGDEGAVAVGIAHSFTESWSASMTLNVTTGSHSEVSSGAGVQFQF